MGQRQPDEAELKRAVAVLMYVFDRTGKIDTASVLKALREAKLEAAVDLRVGRRPAVRAEVLNGFLRMAGPTAVWDEGKDCWRQRRRDDPT